MKNTPLFLTDEEIETILDEHPEVLDKLLGDIDKCLPIVSNNDADDPDFFDEAFYGARA